MSEISRTYPQHHISSSAPLRNQVLREVLLGNLQDSAEAIERCTAGRDIRAVFALPALRDELMESLALMSDSARSLAADDRACMPGVDWATWDALSLQQASTAREWRERVWAIIQVLVPVTRREVSRYLRRSAETASRH
jgi:uncharacterized protein with HEPN domain